MRVVSSISWLVRVKMESMAKWPKPKARNTILQSSLTGSFNGDEGRGLGDLQTALDRRHPGDEITVTILRDDDGSGGQCPADVDLAYSV